MPIYRSFLLALLIILNCDVLRADKLSDENSLNRDASQQLASGSDAQFDKRLPPVLPGEEVRDGKKVIKVWSTAGSVSVGNVPQAPPAPDPWGKNIGQVGVVVDQRSSDREGKEK